MIFYTGNFTKTYGEMWNMVKIR